MRTKRINSQNISNGARRIDGKFFLNEDSLYSAVLEDNENRCLPLSQVADVFNPSIFKRQFCQNTERAVMYFQSSDVPALSEYSSVFINKKQAESLKTLVSENQTLVTGFGTIGNVRLVSKLQEGVCYANNVCRITTKNPNLYGFIYAFMASKYAKAQLNKNASGSVVRFIEAPGIKRTLVPLLPESKQQEIHNLIVESANLRVEANRLLEEAIAYFNDKIEISQNNQKFFSKSIKQLSFSWASYNNNKLCDFIENQIRNNSLKLDEISESIFAPPMFKHIYLNKDNGNPFLTGAELTRQNPKFYRWLSPKGVKDIEDYRVKKGTLLLYKSGTTDGGILGNVFIADDNLDGVCLSDHVIRIRMKKLSDAYWAYAFLKSNAGVQLLLRLATGTMIPFITPERLKELSIPTPDKEYDRIIDLVDKYIIKRVLANNKENQAISLVEKEIESWQQS